MDVVVVGVPVKNKKTKHFLSIHNSKMGRGGKAAVYMCITITKENTNYLIPSHSSLNYSLLLNCFKKVYFWPIYLDVQRTASKQQLSVRHRATTKDMERRCGRRDLVMRNSQSYEYEDENKALKSIIYTAVLCLNRSTVRVQQHCSSFITKKYFLRPATLLLTLLHHLKSRL